MKILLVITLLIIIIPELLIIPFMFMEFILRLFGKSFDDKPKN